MQSPELRICEDVDFLVWSISLPVCTNYIDEQVLKLLPTWTISVLIICFLNNMGKLFFRSKFTHTSLTIFVRKSSFHLTAVILELHSLYCSDFLGRKIWNEKRHNCEKDIHVASIVISETRVNKTTLSYIQRCQAIPSTGNIWNLIIFSWKPRKWQNLILSPGFVKK